MTHYLADRTLVDSSEASRCCEWLLDHAERSTESLGLIPRPTVSSYAPLALLSALLESHPDTKWPLLQLQRTYTELWKLLPEEAKAGYTSQAAATLQRKVLEQCKAAYTSLLDFYHPSSMNPALIDPESGRIVSHNQVVSNVQAFKLPTPIISEHTKPIIAISLPNGPLLGMVVLATATYYIAAPLAYGSGVGKEQFKADVLYSGSNLVVAAQTDIDRLGLCDQWLADARITVVLVEISKEMNLTFQQLDGTPINPRAIPNPVPNHADDTGIMLFTSGTSGNRKLVPLSIHSMICGVAMVEKSWGLSPSMRCLNQMPLNHVGGLIRNLFAPIFSGGSVICCTAFDANLFWDCVEDYAPTWYYASPSMHQVILEAGAARPHSIAQSQIRLICNAAGGLLPSLALRLRNTFSSGSMKCTVLPSYGMTECMPISTPPLDYRLEKSGTSGVSVGPEIAILDGKNQPTVPSGQIGRIAVRGPPVFGGYLENNEVNRSCFTQDGWFDTGDMGHMDEEGFLYITGRSKEVINRGGELISPFEVEEAIIAAANKPDTPIFRRVSKALAFSVPHDVLQEVVGVAITTLEGSQRPCLRGIKESVKSVLSQVKVPVLIVYMEGGLPTINNKLLRIKLAERLNLHEISDETPSAERYFEASCPLPNTPLTTPIGCKRLQSSHRYLEDLFVKAIPANYECHVRQADFYPELVLAPKDAAQDSTTTLADLDIDGLLSNITPKLHGYSMPHKISFIEKPLPRSSFDEIDEIALEKMMNKSVLGSLSPDLDGIELTVGRIFADVLGIKICDISGDSDFFELGGDSMGAGRLLNALRKEYPLRLPISVLFTNPKVCQLAAVLDEKLPRPEGSQGTSTIPHEPEPLFLPGLTKTCTSTNSILLLLQLLPLGLIYPMKRGLTWLVFIYMLMRSQLWPTNNVIPGRLFNLVISLAIGGCVTRIVAPILAIVFKWICIGQHKQGLYPMWGSYHTRWWFVQKVVQVGGLGVFGLFNWTRVLRLRLLGAKIGKNVTIAPGASLGEWDLLTIEDNVILERCIVRPFAAERNTSMYLGRIHIGANSSIGLASTVAAGHTVPPNTSIGPNSSSWELDDADEGNRELTSNSLASAHWALTLLLGLPLRAFVWLVGRAPWLGALIPLVRHEPRSDDRDTLRAVIAWFASPTRINFHYVAMAANVSLGPVFIFVIVLILKKSSDLCFGGVRNGRATWRSHMTTFRMQLLRDTMPTSQFHKVTGLFGVHYNMTSILARALGAKVGQRVYWPGTGPTIQDFDLLEIGDDVVFGSRSHLVTSDGLGSDPITIKSGAMVADRVVLLPGVELGEKTVMGSGAMTKRNGRYTSDTTWVGSKSGEAVCLSANVSTASSSTPSSGNTTPCKPVRLSNAFDEKSASVFANMINMNSTSTTMAVNRTAFYSEASSISTLEKGQSSPSSTVRSSNRFNQKSGCKLRSWRAEQSSSEPESSSPFGRAFYEGRATYRVWTQLEIFFYSTLITIATAVWWNVPSISALQIVDLMYSNQSFVMDMFLAHKWYRPITMYVFLTAIIAAIMAIQTLFVLAFLILAKWVLMGRRKAGNYDWDKSSYCQRWQLFLKLEMLRRDCYGGNGILAMLTGTHWLVLYFRAMGAQIGSDCSLFASGSPSLMFTEPDLLSLGDRVCVDDTSLVGHINTRGKFDLNPLSVGDRSVLRSASRLLSGAKMEEDSCLLEHTLIMAGDVVEKGCTMQGWPAEEFDEKSRGKRTPTMEVVRKWRIVGENEG